MTSNSSQLDLKALSIPFPAEDVEWRLQQAGEKNGKIWAKCLAYITNRAIMARLDDVCGPENWRNEYKEGPSGGLLCGISIYVTRANGHGEWVTKWDGAENTDVEAVKGGLSGAMKRSAVQWGIGRYLYNLDEGFAEVTANGANYGQTKDRKPFRWNPPKLPAWALPSGTPKAAPAQRPSPAPASEEKRDLEAESHTATLTEIDRLLEEIAATNAGTGTRARTRVDTLRAEINADRQKAEGVATGLRSMLATEKEKKAA